MFRKTYRINRNLRATLLLSLAFGLAGCSATQPDFARLYATHDKGLHEDTDPPVILIPGLLGSRLIDLEGREVWPGNAAKLVFGTYENIRLPITEQDPTLTLRAAGITEAALGRDFYGALIRTLTEYGGYKLSEPGVSTAEHNRRLYVFDYDWRQDNVHTAQKLHEFIEKIRADFADPALKFNIIAHSMGGLMARYYLRFGTQDVLNDNRLQITWAGAEAINKIILLGTPNLGSVSSIEGFVAGHKVGLRRIPPEIVATLPSTYQMFPHRIVNWLINAAGEPLDLDPFDVRSWQRHEWNIFSPPVQSRVAERRGADYFAQLTKRFRISAERARRFSWSLTVCPNYDSALGGCPEVAEPPVRIVAFGGNCNETPARYVLEGNELAFSPGMVRNKRTGVDYHRLMFDPGDGTVTKPSLLGRDALDPHTPRHNYSYFPLAYPFLLCEGHATLTGNVHFQDNLLDVLLTRARPWELHKDHAQ